ncbi:Holliday junction branch migration protein RuvA [Paracoccaceae bacterium]|nr:Holliday junction branch migration protein RuvA [Paracoccaceae bacterium]
MIGRIKGQLIEKKNDRVVIDVHGIGYVVYVTEKTARSLSLGNEALDISLFTELLVKEDLLQLIGFLTQIEKDWFNLLRSVQGIGAKVALTILNTLDTNELLRAIRMKNELAFSAVSGIGSRMAQRLVVELSGRKDLAVLEDEAVIEIRDENNEQTLNIIKRKEIQQDALSALQNLGFKSVEAKSAIDKILAEDHINDASELVKEALRSLAKG